LWKRDSEGETVNHKKYSNIYQRRGAQLSQIYNHINNKLNVPDIVVYDVSGTDPRFTETAIKWHYEGELNGKMPHIEYTTITSGKNLIANASINDSYIEFVPVTDQGRGTAAITISIGDTRRTIFVKMYDLSLRLMALEFDDGSSRYTREIVKTLNNAGVSASFYVTGRTFHDIAHEFIGVEVHPEIAVLTFTSGHHIGNHTYSHPWMREYSGGFATAFPDGQLKLWQEYTEEEVVRQVVRADEAICEVLGIIPSYYAPTYCYEGHNEYIAKTGKTFAFREVAPNVDDWDQKTTKDDIVERVLSAPANSTIIVHDVYQKTADAISIIVNSPQAQQIQFVTGYEMDMILGR